MTRHRLDRQIGGQRLRIDTRARTPAERRAARVVFDKLVRQRRREILTALLDKRLAWPDVMEADRNGRLDQVLHDLLLDQPLWAMVDRVFPAPRRETAKRYYVSFQQLKARKVLSAGVTIRDLTGVDWERLAVRWGKSGTDWNHLRRALSRFCSLLFKNKRHPWRDELMFTIPLRREVKRRPRATVGELVALLGALDPPAALVFFTVLATGLRRAEFFRLRRHHLGAGCINVPGTKTAGSERTVPVDPRIWPLVVAAVEARVSVNVWRYQWDRARDATGRRDLRLHDLRRICAQLIAAAGRPLAGLKELLGHAAIKMTEEYATSEAGAKDAAAIADSVAPITKVLQLRRAQ